MYWRSSPSVRNEGVERFGGKLAIEVLVETMTGITETAVVVYLSIGKEKIISQRSKPRVQHL